MANSKRKCRNKLCSVGYFRPEEGAPAYVKWCSNACREVIALEALRKVQQKQERAYRASKAAERVVNAQRKREFKQNDIKTRREAAISWCNKYIRLRDAHKPCISCNARAGSFKLTAGHLITAGSCTALRFDERNIHGQCWWNCNKNRSGNVSEYRKGMLTRHGKRKGKKILEFLDGPQPVINITVDFYRDIEIKYKSKCKELQSLGG